MKEKPSDKKKGPGEALFVKLREAPRRSQAASADEGSRLATGETLAQGAKKKGPLNRAFFLQKAVEYAEMDKEGKRELEIAGELKISNQHITTVKKLAVLADGVRPLVLNGKLAVSTAVIIARYPPGLHTLFADSIINKKLPLNQLQRGPIRSALDLKQPIRGSVEAAGLTWPAGLDPNGKPIEK